MLPNEVQATLLLERASRHVLGGGTLELLLYRFPFPFTFFAGAAGFLASAGFFAGAVFFTGAAAFFA